MIEIIPTFLTPAMLAISPPAAVPAQVSGYDWQSQRAIVSQVDGSGKQVAYGTLQGSSSYAGGTYTIDDWRSD